MANEQGVTMKSADIFEHRGAERAAAVAAEAYVAGASLAEAFAEAAAFMRAWNAHPSHARTRLSAAS